MKRNKLNLFTTIVGILIINIFGIQGVQANKIESTITTDLLSDSSASLITSNSLQTEPKSAIESPQNKTKPESVAKLSDAVAYNDRGNERAAAGDHQGAIADFTEAIKLQPNYFEAYNNRGNVRFVIGDKQSALADFDRAMQLNPQPTADDYKNRGGIRWSLGDKTGALADFDRAIQLNPQPGADDYKTRGNLQWDIGNKKAALADFDRAIALNPTDSSVYNSRGSIRAELGDQRAIADFSQALVLNPQSTDTYNSRGNARAQLGDKQGAIADFNQVIQLNPNDAQAYNNRGNIRAALDDRPGAIADYTQALKINPNYTEAEQNRRGLLFPTTPQIQAELIFGGGSVSGGKAARDLSALSKESFSLLTSVSVTHSFTGYDRLLARFQASAFGALTSTDPGGYTPEGRLSWTDGTLNNQPGLQALTYQFPLSPSTEVALAIRGGDSIETIAGKNINPHFSGGGSSGSISYFGSSPSFYNHASGTGFGIQQKLGSQFELGAGYLSQSGLFSGESAGLVRLLYKPNDQSKIGLTYVNSDRTPTFTGSRNVNSVYAQGTNQALGLEGYYQASPNFGLGGWIGHTTSDVSGGKATSLSWAISAAFPHNNGNVAGLLVGQEPHVTGATGSLSSFIDPSSSLHLEAFYQYKINDMLSITPGLIYVTATDSNSQNGGALIGAIRTNFSFSF